MSSTMRYKGDTGSVEFSEADGVFYGKVLGIHSLISYEGATASELVSDFHGAVDDYLEFCKADGIVLETAYKGSFNIRITPQLHEKLAIYALDYGISLNKLVEQALKAYKPLEVN